MPHPELILRRSREVIFTSVDVATHERVDAFSTQDDTAECPIAFAKDHSTTAIATKSNISVYHQGVGGVSLVGNVPESNVLHTAVSANGKFLVTYSAVTSKQNANVAVWDLSTLEPITRFQQHSWPVFSWSGDGETCLRFTTSAVLVLRGNMHDVAQIGRVPVAPVKGKEYTCEIQRDTLVLIQPSDRDTEGSVQLYALSDLSAPCNVFSLDTLDGGEILWSPSETHAIVVTRVDTDRSNKSYYGTRGVLLVDCVKRKMKVIKLAQGSSPHDICWNPSGSEFAIVHGKMPQNGATIYSQSGAPLFEFASAPRNIVSWAPNGRTIALGGSGSLNGEFVFWDRENLENSTKVNGRMGGFVMKCSSYSWSPCSRYFLCAVLASRMQVGNCLTIWTSTGEKFASIPMDHLLEACWVSYDPKIYANIPFTAKYQSGIHVEKKPALFVPKHRSEEAAKFLQRGNTNGVKRVTKPMARHEGVLGAVVEAARPNSPANASGRHAPRKGGLLTDGERAEAERKLRAQQKKLREIEKLKEVDHASLTEAQVEKLGKVASVEAEVTRLNTLLVNSSL